MVKRFAVTVRGRHRTTAALLLVLMIQACAVPLLAEKKLKPLKASRHSQTREIEVLEEQWRTAVMTGDAATVEKLLSDDFLAISARGTVSDKQQYLHRISTHTTQFPTFDLINLKIRVQQDSAVAVSQAHIAGTLEGRPIEGTFLYTKVYGRSPGGSWRMTNFEATRVSASTSNTSDMDRGTPLLDGSTRGRER